MKTIPSHRTAARAVAASLALLALCAGPARAQNIVPNGTFDGGIGSFAPNSVAAEIAWDPGVEFDDRPGSGSLRVSDVSNHQPALAIASRCVSGHVPAGSYYFEFWTRFAPGETANGKAAAYVYFYPNSNCSGSPNGYVGTTPADAIPAWGRGLWTRLRGGDIRNAAVTLPQGAFSYSLHAFVNKTSGSVLTANFDHFFLAPVGKPLCAGRVPTTGGSDAADALFGTPGPDVIVAFGGDDQIFAGDGKDVVCAGAGNDVVDGGAKRDRLFGEAGDDELYGGGGRDVLKGGPGGDFLAGEEGKDLCVGGGGNSDVAHGSCEKTRSTP